MKNLTFALMIAAALLLGASCEKENPQDAPQPFEPRIDGVAVRPLPPIDTSKTRFPENEADQEELEDEAEQSPPDDLAEEPEPETPTDQTTEPEEPNAT